jgi:uncharacterized peroxidase-related enzyme
MDPRARPTPRLAPLPPAPALKEIFDVYEKALGFIPNSALIMQRKPGIVRGFAQLWTAINADPDAQVSRGFKRLIAHIASRAAGCQYCMAHTAGSAMRFGIEEAKLDAVWQYKTSPLYTEAERVALDFALAAASIPNDVSDEMFAELRKHWNDTQVVEIVAVIAIFGFLNRWNDTFATPLEEEPIHVGERYLSDHGWKADKHLRAVDRS